MSHTVILIGESQREYAKRLIDAAPLGFVMRLFERKRTTEQNDKMWAMLTDISHAKPMGIRETPDGWKALIMHACGHEVQFMQGLDGRPFPVGFRSSKLTIRQMSEMIEWMLAFGAEHGVTWSDETKEVAA